MIKFIFLFLLVLLGCSDLQKIEKKIGKLFCVPVCPNRGDDHREDVRNLIKNYHVRSFLLKQGTINQAKDLVKWLKKTAKEPILIVADAEWGLAMTLSDGKTYPKNNELTKLSSSEIYNIGKSIACDCKNLGIQLNLAPVVDVASNNSNPIIGQRSFSSNPQIVADNAFFIAKGMKDHGLAICLKHFPGHGDVPIDSHKNLPVSHKSVKQMYLEELLPYIKLKSISPDCIMVSHILFTAIDADFPASISYKTINFLKKIMGDDVLIVSDALNMKALTNHYDVEEIARRAYSSGIDLLLYGDHITLKVDQLLKEDIPKAILSLIKFQKNNFSSTKQLDKKTKKINSLSVL